MRFTSVRCCGSSRASIPHALAGKTPNVKCHSSSRAVAFDSRLPPIGPAKDSHLQSFNHAQRTRLRLRLSLQNTADSINPILSHSLVHRLGGCQGAVVAPSEATSSDIFVNVVDIQIIIGVEISNRRCYIREAYEWRLSLG